MNYSRRVLFSERQRLRAGDLLDEQQHLLGLAGRHQAGFHQWGIVRGFDLSVEQGALTIAPGVGIDGYGRELAVWQPVTCELPQSEQCRYVFLYYCERPQGNCGSTPHSRWQDSAEIAISPEPWPIPEEAPAVDMARAAGNLTDAPPWPMLLGAIGIDDKIDISNARITRLRAARVVSPSGKAVMRIGQENSADQYHVRISGRDAKGTMKDRLAFDRDGNPVVWGNLTITGADRVAFFSVGQRLLKITQQPSIASPVKWQVVPLNGGVKRLILRGPGGREECYEFTNASNDKDSKKWNRDSKLVSVQLLGRTRFQSEMKVWKKKAASKEVPVGEEVFDDRESSIEHGEGGLSFEPEGSQTVPIPCGCEDARENPANLPEGLVFQPGVVPPDNSSRDIQYLRFSVPEKAPVDEMRISGGAFKDGDSTRRVSIGARNGKEGFNPWLSMHGNGMIELYGGTSKINAIGTIVLPPVKPDPRDPLFNYLTVIAFIHGVLSLRSSLLKITLSNVPGSINVGAANWSYDLTLENSSLTEPLVLLKNIVMITGDNKTARLTEIRNLPIRLEARQSKQISVVHLATEIPKDATKLIVTVTVVMQSGGLTVAGQATSSEISVTNGVIN